MSDVRRSPIRDSRLGSVLRGIYRLDHLLGRGATGSVYRATNLLDESQAAVKLLRSVPGAIFNAATEPRVGAEGTPEAERNARRFAREARIIAGLNHPHIVKIFDFEGSEGEGDSYLAMELLTGETLGKRLVRGPISPQEALQLYTPLCSAMSHAHAHGVIHRDLKPDNVFLVGGDLHDPRVLDFGISKVLDPGASQLTDDSILGTPAYMAPELVRAPAQADPRVDVFALGAMLFHLLTGHLPFEGETMLAVLRKLLSEDPPSLRSYRPELSPELDQMVLRAMARDPAQRFQSAEEMLLSLKQTVLSASGRLLVAPLPEPEQQPGPPHEDPASARTPLTADPIADTWAAGHTSLLAQVSAQEPGVPDSAATPPAPPLPTPPARASLPPQDPTPTPVPVEVSLHTVGRQPGPREWLKERWPEQWWLAVLLGGVLGMLIGLVGLLSQK